MAVFLPTFFFLSVVFVWGFFSTWGVGWGVKKEVKTGWRQTFHLVKPLSPAACLMELPTLLMTSQVKTSTVIIVYHFNVFSSLKHDRFFLQNTFSSPHFLRPLDPCSDSSVLIQLFHMFSANTTQMNIKPDVFGVRKIGGWACFNFKNKIFHFIQLLFCQIINSDKLIWEHLPPPAARSQ